MTDWKDTTEQWPEHGQQCLFWYENAVHMGFFNTNNARFYHNGSLDLAPLQTRYWMPMPNSPKLGEAVPYQAPTPEAS